MQIDAHAMPCLYALHGCIMDVFLPRCGSRRDGGRDRKVENDYDTCSLDLMFGIWRLFFVITVFLWLWFGFDLVLIWFCGELVVS